MRGPWKKGGSLRRSRITQLQKTVISMSSGGGRDAGLSSSPRDRDGPLLVEHEGTLRLGKPSLFWSLIVSRK